MLRKIGVTLLGLVAAAVLASIFYGLCVLVGHIGTQYFDSILFTSESLFLRGLVLVGYGFVIIVLLTFIVFIGPVFCLAAYGLGEFALSLGRRLCSKPKKYRT